MLNVKWNSGAQALNIQKYTITVQLIKSLKGKSEFRHIIYFHCFKQGIGFIWFCKLIIVVIGKNLTLYLFYALGLIAIEILGDCQTELSYAVLCLVSIQPDSPYPGFPVLKIVINTWLIFTNRVRDYYLGLVGKNLGPFEINICYDGVAQGFDRRKTKRDLKQTTSFDDHDR